MSSLRAQPKAMPRVLALLAALSLVAATAFASAPPGAGGPEPLAPRSDAVLSESGITFAWQPVSGTDTQYLVLSDAPFDASGWTRLPDDPAFRVIPAAKPLLAWSELGRDLVSDTRVYWAVGEVDPESGRASFSTVRSVYVIRKFSNRAEQSPLVSISPIVTTGPAASGPRRIRLAAGFQIDPALGEPPLPATLREAAGSIHAPRSLLVYYGDADPEQTRREILAGGGAVVAYVPDHTFLVRLAPERELSFAAPDAWVGAYHPAYKLSPRLSTAASGGVRDVSVLLFPDASLSAAETAARGQGAQVLARSDNGINKILRLRLPEAAVQELARSSDVQWMEPYTPNIAYNDNAQQLVQTGTLNLPGSRRLWDLGLKGEGQVVMTSDTGINTTHYAMRDPAVPITDFGNYPTHRKVIAYLRGTADPGVAFGDHGQFHGSHTAGTVAGNDDAFGSSARDGMAKNAKLWFVDMSGPTLNNVLLTPPDLNDLFQPGYTGNAGGAARIASNSWGTPVSGAYTVDSYTADQFMWNHPDFLIFFSNGNDGSSGLMSVGSPASAKNIVSVGATYNGANYNSLASFSSLGPTADGRYKPTLCAPGSIVNSSTTDSITYAGLSGTSMSSPAAAGCAALIRQYCTEGWYPTGAKVPGNAFTPSAALLKAMCVNSSDASVAGTQAPDNLVGWGRIDADSVLYFAGDTRRLLLVDQTAGLGNGQAIEYKVNVVDANSPLKVSLVWTDYPGDPAASTQLVNDLDLTVSKGATTYLGNHFSSGFSSPGSPRDSSNVEEGAKVAVPALGVWTIRVSGTSVPVGPQPFALVVTGGLGTTAGALALDRASYGSASTVQLRVTDTNAGSPVSVSIASNSEPSGEIVTLTGSNGVLQGSIPLSPVTGTVGNGTLFVSNGDLITATYVDANPSATIVATALVGLEPPTITGVHAADAGSGSEILSWTTNVSADSRVYYGPTVSLGSSTPLAAAAVLQHGVVVSGLTVGQTYYYDVESRDLNGNVTRDDNGGAHYAFTVGPRSDILLVYDGVLFERENRYAAALAATGWTADVWKGSLSATPRLGSSSVGLRSYRAVWWQNGIDHYPPFTDVARDSIAAYLSGGGRLAVGGHDIAWANMVSNSGYSTAARVSWMQNTLHTQFLSDPASWSGVKGIASDPISGAYTSGLSYTPYRAGAGGDEISSVPGAGTASYDWLSGDSSPDNCGFRWESSATLGTPGVGVWGGATSRLATMYFEWSGIDNANGTNSALRNDVLQKTLVWLIGRAKPTAAVVSPNGGETLTGSTANVTWTESTAGGTSVASRAIDYSLDGGQSWVSLTASAGPSPYVWSLTGVPNTSQGRVRVRITDTGAPSLTTIDASNADFTLSHGGGDLVGPVVVAGSIHANPDPVDTQRPLTLTASLTDARAGGSAVTQAEWSFGASPATAGSGAAMSGTFGSVTATVSVSIVPAGFAHGTGKLWVRGRDAAGNWGPAGFLAVVVNGPESTGVPSLPREYALGPGSPNPTRDHSRVSYALPTAGSVDLDVYDVTGRRVRALVHGLRPAGVQEADWDLRDDSGRLVGAGIYYYRLAVAGRSFTRRMVALD